MIICDAPIRFSSRARVDGREFRRGNRTNEPYACSNPLVEVRKMKLLVRGMNSIIGKSKAHQHRWYAEYVLERADHRNRAARTQEDRRGLEPSAIGHSRRPHGAL